MSDPEKKPIRVLVVDDHEVVRAGIRSLLRRPQSIEVVGEAGNVASAVAETKRLAPDVVLLDVRLEKGSGLEAFRQIQKFPNQPRVLILTAYADDEIVTEAIAAGVDGYLLKEINGARLIEAIEQVALGQSVLDSTITRQVMGKIAALCDASPADKFFHLSAQEKRILALVAEGKTNKEIADIMQLSVNTVRNYFSNLMEKLQMSRRSQAAVFYVENVSK